MNRIDRMLDYLAFIERTLEREYFHPDIVKSPEFRQAIQDTKSLATNLLRIRSKAKRISSIAKGARRRW